MFENLVVVSDDFPCVSLLVACRNEVDSIKKCIESLFAQDFPGDKLEVIILDGLSTDGSRELIRDLIAGHPNFRLVDNPKIHQAAAWNLGLELCTGEVISIVSGHVILSPDYVIKAIETLQRTGADMVGGTVRSVSDGLVGKAIAIAISHPFGVGGARFRYTDKEEETDSVFMGFCHRSVFEKNGKFDEELVRNQDDEFSYRLRKSGGRIICNPDIQSLYQSRSNYKSLWRQYFQYGLYKVRVLQKHHRQMSPRQFIPPAFVTGILLSIILSVILSWGWIVLAGLIGIYFLVNVIVSLKIALREGLQYLPLLPIVFPTLHVSYGLGFISGLFKFWDRWNDKLGKVARLERR